MSLLIACAVLLSTTPKTAATVTDDLSYRAFRYLWEQTTNPTYLTGDRGNNSANGATPTWVPASVAATGYSLAADAIGSARGWIDRPSALARARATAKTLATKAANYRGWFLRFVSLHP